MFSVGDVVEVLDFEGNKQNIKGNVIYVGDDDLVTVKCVREDGTIYNHSCYLEDLELIFEYM